MASVVGNGVRTLEGRDRLPLDLLGFGGNNISERPIGRLMSLLLRSWQRACVDQGTSRHAISNNPVYGDETMRKDSLTPEIKA
ncbi:hypothetical protein RRG08_030697 [Elysia crispata]|uniref:Uncharacterized protein n=1 Tax=Elysia crispata TaxID=231223 RepID=A0AAE0Y4C6_9GAST|nr:hypothetical protein RRG08_030697 [Elysia crispata]